MPKNILITGASGGFGKLITQTLLKQKHTVVASMRGPDGKNKAVAEELRAAGAHIVEIDVTDDASVDQGIAAALEQVDEIDVVINNAGLGAIGLQENFTPEDWQYLFDINLFGVQRVNRAILPHMRARKSGLLIHVSSLLGRISLPFYGPYNATKWALEVMAENYRAELSGFGIDVCLVEPGGFATTFMDNLLKPSDTDRDATYGEFAQGPMQLFTSYEQALADNPAQDPQNVADAIVDLIETPAGQRAFRTTIDNMGMGEPIHDYNQQLEQITSGIYNAFGMGDMLTLAV
jgi:NAD(P)-dependent dehydrogenase (short-subunit alcohol dehydrogenase family)